MALTTEELEAIRERWRRATAGPWRYDESYFIRPAELAPGFAQVNGQVRGKPSAVVALTFERWPRWGEDEVLETDWVQTRRNAIAIAAAPEDIAALLAHAEAQAATVARLTAARARERDARQGLWQDAAHFAQTNHQAHHAAHSGAWLTCDRGTCPGLRRALARGSDDAVDAATPAGAAGAEGTDGNA